MIHGLVERPLILTMKDIVRFPSVSRIHFIECPANGGMEWRAAQLNSLQFNHGMISCAEWTGVKLSTLLEEVGLKKEARWAMVEGADGAHMNRSLPLDKCLDDCLVVYAQNGEALRPEQGYPLRLVVPGWEGNVSIKWLRRIKLGDRPWYSREETSKYTDLMPDGTSRGFTWLIDAKSVITFPCPEKPLSGPGLYEIRGLAWSGNGKVRQVDVSADGGVNWQRAQLHDPVLSKALTRFTLPWRWDGRPALLESRVIDETGYVQPTITQLRKAAWVEFGLSQQLDPDLAGQAGRKRVRCSDLVTGLRHPEVAREARPSKGARGHPSRLAARAVRAPQNDVVDLARPRLNFDCRRRARPFRLRQTRLPGRDCRLGYRRPRRRWCGLTPRQGQRLAGARRSMRNNAPSATELLAKAKAASPSLLGASGR